MTTLIPKKRIDVIDALRGMALMAILLIHSMEHFELYKFAEETSPLIKWFNTTTHDVFFFVFARKSYAIFSLLFGLSFFIQMENQAGRGVDFRWRFAWRMALLYALGYVNGLMYFGEIFVIYAVFGLILIPLYKVPSRWLIVLSLLCLLQLHEVIKLVRMFFSDDPASVAYSSLRAYASGLSKEGRVIYAQGDFTQFLSFNLWSAHLQKWILLTTGTRGIQVVGLFIAGLLLGRSGIHKSEERMVHYAGKALLFGLLIFTLFFCALKVVLLYEISAPISKLIRTLFGAYSDLGFMLVLIGAFVLAYFRLGAKKTLDYLAPVGRMSLTNYIVQSYVCVPLFYGFGLALAMSWGVAASFMIGLALCVVQIIYSRCWLKHYYYGPVEWLWRSATWFSFKKMPFLRKEQKIREDSPERVL